MKKNLTKKSDDVSRWYNEVIEKAKLADQAPVKGCMVIMPYGYALWENIQVILDRWFKADQVQNVYFPLFIPYSLIEKEKKHVEGFSPELALVTIAGGEKLKEPLVVRPTSETIMYQTFSKWISSYKDLPLKINQWCNVVRWEKRTYPFLRTSEFLWQEGHTAHTNEAEAMEMVMKVLHWYQDVFEKFLGISVYTGIKSESEKFAGAKQTFSVELVISNGKALQGATSHNLGQNFAKSFDIKFLDSENKSLYPYQTCWGISTRSIGGLILSHGDDNGLVLPPLIAPIKIIFLPIISNDEAINAKIETLIKKLILLLDNLGFSYKIDRSDKSLGYRISESEISGIPLRLEIGKKEVMGNYITVSRRDTLEKETVGINAFGNYIDKTLGKMQERLLHQSQENKKKMTVDVSTYAEFKKIMSQNRKFIRAFWCESGVCERKIKEQTKATTRVCELDQISKRKQGSCIYCENKATRQWLFAQAY